MANKATLDKTIQGTLQRGKACLRCRKRKMRCDGLKPACQQCVRSKKGDACEYDDGKGKTRTQLLREHIARLEQRIRELEDPDYVSPAVTLYDPHVHSRSGSSSSSFGSPGSAYQSASHSPFPSESPSSPQTSWSGMQNIPSPSASPFAPEITNGHPQPPIELAQMLLDIFAPYRHQCGLDVHFGQLRDSLTHPIAGQRHPALMNAIFLWACFVSRPEPLCQHEEHYLDLALKAIPDALRRIENTVDIIQASCLLSVYFLANGRFNEGGYHASAAASLALQNGLGDGDTYLSYAYTYDEGGENFEFKPPRSDIKTGERILTFWQVYNLDRCWSVVLRRPAIIPDSLYAISCPWPQSIPEYESGHIINSSSSLSTIEAFLRGDVDPNSFSVQALRVKASTLFACASNITINRGPSTKLSDILQELQVLEHSIAHFSSTLINLEQLDAISVEDRFSLLVTHTLGHTAMIQLYRSFSPDDALSFEKCARAARSCIMTINQLSDQDFAFLDPIVGPCWSIVAEFLVQEMDSMESTWPFMNTRDVRNDLSIVLFALTRLMSRFPIVAPSITQLRKRLAQPSLS